MGALFALPNGKLPQLEEEIQPVPCARSPHGGTMLPTPSSVSRNVERALACAYFPHTLGRSALLCPRCCTFLSRVSVTMPGERTFNERNLAENNPLKRLSQDSTPRKLSLAVRNSLGRAGRSGNWQRDRDGFYPCVISIGEQCFKAASPTVPQVMMHYRRAGRRTDARTACRPSPRKPGFAENPYDSQQTRC